MLTHIFDCRSNVTSHVIVVRPVEGVDTVRTDSLLDLEKATSEVEKVRKVLRKRGQKND